MVRPLVRHVAGIVLGAGLFRVLYYAKGTAFYMSNPFFT
jgi:uncharacterized membrane protein